MASASATLFSVCGKNVLVTGGSRGIGAMIAKGFCEAGANVLLTSRDEKACRETAVQITASAQQMNTEYPIFPVSYVTSSLGSRKGCEDLAAYTAQHFGNRLDILINNAGTSWGEPLERESSQRSNWGFDKVLDLNVKSLFYLTRSCLPSLESSASPTDPARVIVIGSIAGIRPQIMPTHAYDASKAAAHQLTLKFATDLAPKNITVNAIAPGYVPSRMSAGLKTWGADGETITSTIPLGRMGAPDDMAGAALFFSSRAGSWCTGVILPVDGGATGAYATPMKSSL